MHYANPEIAKFGNVVFVFYIGSGLFAGIMTLMDEGIELALGWHAANNMVAALLVTADWTALQTHSVLKDISNPETMPCLLYTSPSPRDQRGSRMPSSA